MRALCPGCQQCLHSHAHLAGGSSVRADEEVYDGVKDGGGEGGGEVWEIKKVMSLSVLQLLQQTLGM